MSYHVIGKLSDLACILLFYTNFVINISCDVIEKNCR